MTISLNYCLSRDLSLTTTFNYLYLLKVHFWVKTAVPDSHDDVITFIQRLASVGVNLEAYRKAYEVDHEERYLLQTK